MTKCDAIAWLVDMLGTQELIAVASDATVYADTRANKERAGLYFHAGHWYCSKDGKISDSYSLNYQIKGTAHFCQTFATMIYLGKTSGLVSGKYGDNIKDAMDFWIVFFSSYPNITKWFLEKNVHVAEEWKDDLINLNDLAGEGNVALKRLKPAQLIQYLKTVKSDAQSLTGCMQG